MAEGIDSVRENWTERSAGGPGDKDPFIIWKDRIGVMPSLDCVAQSHTDLLLKLLLRGLKKLRRIVRLIDVVP